VAATPHDPLAFIPSPEAVRRRLDEALTLARRLRLLLRLSEKLQQAGPPDTVRERVPAVPPHAPNSTVGALARKGAADA
jgi:hypothetical protein